MPADVRGWLGWCDPSQAPQLIFEFSLTEALGKPSITKKSQGIHSKIEKIGGVYSSAQKDWRKKCVNGDDKKLRQEYVNHEIYAKMTYLLKNMILVCVYLRFKQLLNRVGRK